MLAVERVLIAEKALFFRDSVLAGGEVSPKQCIHTIDVTMMIVIIDMYIFLYRSETG